MTADPRSSGSVSDPETDADCVLLERARAGDPDALDRLFAPQVDALRRWIRGRLPKWAGSMTDTDDLVQDTLLQTFKRLRCFEPRGAGALQAYVRQAALNHLRDELRRRSRRPYSTDMEDVELAGGDSPLEDAIGHEAVETYERALRRLSAKERETIVGRIELGYSYEELARALGKPSVDAARKAAQRAVLRLAEEMSYASATGRAVRQPARQRCGRQPRVAIHHEVPEGPKAPKIIPQGATRQSSQAFGAFESSGPE